MTSAFTREMLLLSLRLKVPLSERPDIGIWGAARIADAITHHGLLDVIAGRHDGKPITFSKAFELIYGERLKLKGAA